MGIASTFCNHSPIWIQNLACTLQGRKIKRTRYDVEFRELLAFSEEPQWWPTGPSWGHRNKKVMS